MTKKTENESFDIGLGEFDDMSVDELKHLSKMFNESFDLYEAEREIVKKLLEQHLNGPKKKSVD